MQNLKTTASIRISWNKGELLGVKPVLCTKDGWSLTKVQVECMSRLDPFAPQPMNTEKHHV